MLAGIWLCTFGLAPKAQSLDDKAACKNEIAGYFLSNTQLENKYKNIDINNLGNCESLASILVLSDKRISESTRIDAAKSKAQKALELGNDAGIVVLADYFVSEKKNQNEALKTLLPGIKKLLPGSILYFEQVFFENYLQDQRYSKHKQEIEDPGLEVVSVAGYISALKAMKRSGQCIIGGPEYVSLNRDNNKPNPSPGTKSIPQSLKNIPSKVLELTIILNCKEDSLFLRNELSGWILADASQSILISRLAALLCLAHGNDFSLIEQNVGQFIYSKYKVTPKQCSGLYTERTSIPFISMMNKKRNQLDGLKVFDFEEYAKLLYGEITNEL